MSVTAKAIISVRRHAATGKWTDYEMEFNLFRANPGPYAWDSARESLSIMKTDHHPMPPVVYRMTVGERLVLSVNFTVEYSQDYWGEWDEELYFTRIKTLKRRFERNSKKARNKRYGRQRH